VRTGSEEEEEVDGTTARCITIPGSSRSVGRRCFGRARESWRSGASQPQQLTGPISCRSPQPQRPHHSLFHPTHRYVKVVRTSMTRHSTRHRVTIGSCESSRLTTVLTQDRSHDTTLPVMRALTHGSASVCVESTNPQVHRSDEDDQSESLKRLVRQQQRNAQLTAKSDTACITVPSESQKGAGGRE
jgi:hypothetical protein